jgi:flagellin-like protein
MSIRRNEEGVSVIVGTLLLILITVTAAAGLAIMVSQMQKDEMNRQSHLSSVKNEQIQITGVTFDSGPAELDRFYWPPNSTLNTSYRSVTFTLSNMNTEESRVIGISINDVYSHNFTVIADSSTPYYVPYNFSSKDPSSYLSVPASGSEKVRINFTNDFYSPPQHIGHNDQITIRVMTTLYNTFEKSFQPPNPVIVSNTEAQNLGTIRRETLVLDGSRSFSPGNTTIVDWSWSVQDASGTMTAGVIDQQGNCSDTLDLGPPNYTQGKMVRIQPKLPGPFCVNLTVQDSIGMKKSSDYIVVPRNDLFIPPANFMVTFNRILPGSFINVTIKDLNGNPVTSAVVNYIIDTNQFGNLSLDNYVGVTDINGMNSSNVTSGIGSVKVVSGNFAPVDVAVRGSS